MRLTLTISLATLVACNNGSKDPDDTDASTDAAADTDAATSGDTDDTTSGDTDSEVPAREVHIGNAGFEAPALAVDTWTDSCIGGWTATGNCPFGTLYPAVGNLDQVAPLAAPAGGNLVGYANCTGAVSVQLDNATGLAIEEGVVYTASIAVGKRNELGAAPGHLSIVRVDDTDSTATVLATAALPAADSGAWATGSVEYTAVSADVGGRISLRLDFAGSDSVLQQALFDNVALTALGSHAAMPESVSDEALGATCNAAINDGGGGGGVIVVH